MEIRVSYLQDIILEEELCGVKCVIIAAASSDCHETFQFF